VWGYIEAFKELIEQVSKPLVSGVLLLVFIGKEKS
jgi:hypothetical protein